ncbi:MAG: FGGY family carbohydrate kinase [Armatimonadota bacterium]
MPNIAIVLDCGATNATVVAIDADGNVLASASRPQAPVPQPGGPEGMLIWDLDEIWGKLAEGCLEVIANWSVPPDDIKGVTVTTFGADGAPVKRDGSLTYPIISWQCERCQPQLKALEEQMDPYDIFAETGYLLIPFNTLLRFMWLRQNAPEALEEADTWLMTPGLLSQRLCGEPSLDPTIGGTMMAMNMAQREWSEKMLSVADLEPDFFPPWVEPGNVIGHVTEAAARETGLPVGTPVVAAGHDTQFAAVGSGARPGEAILSSGTWEILMLRHQSYEPSRFAFEEGVLVECDAERGLWNPQLLMMASGVLEWIGRHFYADVERGQEAYERMIEEASKVAPGSDGVTILPSFVPETGPTKKHNTHGTILGLGITTSRAEVYRAALEGLCFQLRHALEILSQATGFQAQGVRVVGGGSRNDLWNKIRADATDLPVTTIAQRDATVLGAAMFALIGAGTFASVAEAQRAMTSGESVVEPSEDAAEAYADLYQRYRLAAPALEGFYKA